MQTLLPKLYGEYGRYINEFRQFPSVLDGCKIVERRLLYSTFLTAKDKRQKAAKVVGHCIGSFHPHGDCGRGTTKIPLLDGTVRTMHWLKKNYKDKEFWVYSCTPEGKIVPGRAHSPKVGHVTDVMYRITLDNGKTDDFTENHPFMMRNGTYTIAGKLKENDLLMPIEITEHGGYTYYKDSSSTKKEKVAIMVCKMFDENYNENMSAHHIDYNKKNDNPENIRSVTRQDHTRIHFSDPATRKKCVDSLRESWWGSKRQKNISRETANKNWSDENYRNHQSDVHKTAFDRIPRFKEKALKGLDKGRYEMYNPNGKFYNETKERNSNKIKDVNKKLPKIKIMRILKDMIDDDIEINEENYIEYRKSDKYYNYAKWNKISFYFGDINTAIDCAVNYNNHYVVKVEKIKLKKPIKFYDLSVDKYHNFALDSGIIVHNTSTYQALVTLVHNKFVVGQGNWGINIGIEPSPAAAQRYTECKSNKEILDMAFENINIVPMEAREIDMEPIFLPTKYPFCLLGESFCQGIGFGYRTIIPCYAKTDLKKRLEWLLKRRKTEPVINPKIDCDLISIDKSIVTTGRGKMLVKGRYTVDTVNKSVIITSIPPGKTFISLLKKFSKEVEVEKSVGYIDESKTSTKVRLKILRPRMITMQKLTDKLDKELNGTVTFECNMVNTKGKVVLVSVDGMLLNIYGLHKKIVEGVLNKEIKDIDEKIIELQYLAQIKPKLSYQLKLNPNNIDLVIKNICSVLKIDVVIVKTIFDKFTLARIFKTNTETAELNVKRKDKIDKLNNIDDYIWKEKYK